MQTQYGRSTAGTMKNYASLAIQFGKLTARKYFLLQCRKINIEPKHVLQNTNHTNQLTCEIIELMKSAQTKLLNIEIKIVF